MIYQESMPITDGQILCCQCGLPITPTPTSMCLDCSLRCSDLTKGISRQGTLVHCRSCDRFLDPPTSWVPCQLQSQDLLKICLKKIHGLDKVKVVDVNFLFTEEHSRRVKLQLAVVDGSEITEKPPQHHLVVEFVVQNQMCPACQRREAKSLWNSLVQVRQKVQHKRTFLYLEQLILKNKIGCSSIKPAANGMDFLFDRREAAAKFAQFVQTAVPSRQVMSNKLVSQDVHNNTKDCKITFSLEIVPICKDDIVCLPPSLARSLGQRGQLCVCLSLTSHIKLIDPQTAHVAEIDSQKYWKNPFPALAGVRDFRQFTVMDTEFLGPRDSRPSHKGAASSSKHTVMGVWVVPSDQLEAERVYCRTHLGHLLHIWDSVLGFDLRTTNVNNSHLDDMDPAKVPDVILVKKVYPDRRKKRSFKLRRLAGAAEEAPSELEDLDRFLEDLEEDDQIRKNVDLFKAPEANSVPEEDEEEDFPSVDPSELLEEED